MYKIRHIKLLAVSDGHVTSATKRINEPKDIAHIIKPLLWDADREHCLVIMLNGKNRITAINTVSIGTLTSSLVHPREVFKPAILTNAASIILAHNHPSGDPMPSEDDLNITIRLKAAGELLGISVLDHIIIGDSYYSTESNKSYPFEDEEGE